MRVKEDQDAWSSQDRRLIRTEGQGEVLEMCRWSPQVFSRLLINMNVCEFVCVCVRVRCVNHLKHGWGASSRIRGGNTQQGQK